MSELDKAVALPYGIKRYLEDVLADGSANERVVAQTALKMLADHRQQVIDELVQRSVEMPEFDTFEATELPWKTEVVPVDDAKEKVREAIAAMQAQIEELGFDYDRHANILKSALEQSEAQVVELKKVLDLYRLLSSTELKKAVISAMNKEQS